MATYDDMIITASELKEKAHQNTIDINTMKQRWFDFCMRNGVGQEIAKTLELNFSNENVDKFELNYGSILKTYVYQYLNDDDGNNLDAEDFIRRTITQSTVTNTNNIVLEQFIADVTKHRDTRFRIFGDELADFLMKKGFTVRTVDDTKGIMLVSLVALPRVFPQEEHTM